MSTKKAASKKSVKPRNSPHIISYIFKIDSAIRNGDYPNASKMNRAEGWSLSRSTFGRYIDILRDTYGAPLEFDYKKNGYYYTDSSFYIKQVMFNEGELLTLSTIIPLLEQYKNTPLESSYRNLMNKLIKMLPDNITVDSALINNEVHFISDPITKLEDKVFENVLKATKIHCTLELEYKTAQNTKYEKRLFDPYHMICQKGSWYVLGFSHSSDAIRLWAMPRIKNCKITREKFSIPKSFKLEDHIDIQMGAWGHFGQKYKVEIEFTQSLKTYVMERTWHKGQKIRVNKNGSVYLSFETNQLTQTCAWVMSFAGDAKVLNPPELKRLVRESAKKILGGR